MPEGAASTLPDRARASFATAREFATLAPMQLRFTPSAIPWLASMIIGAACAAPGRRLLPWPRRHPRRPPASADFTAGRRAPARPRARAHARRRERRGLLVLGRRPAHHAGAPGRRRLRSHLPAAAARAADAALPRPVPVSSGRGATTCSYFLPGDQRGHLRVDRGRRSPACPPRPDHSQGYVWALYPDYDIYRANADGSGAAPAHRRRPATTPRAPSAARTARSSSRRCATATSISTAWTPTARTCGASPTTSATTAAPSSTPTARRSSGARRARSRAASSTTTSACSRRTWCARPSSSSTSPTPTAATRRRSPTSTRRRSAPAWAARRDKRARLRVELRRSAGARVRLWAIDVDGTRLERITTAPGFDGFPLFSPDGKRLAFSSNRATPPGAHDTNVFVADWRRRARAAGRASSPADRVAADIRWLADPAREGRGVGTRRPRRRGRATSRSASARSASSPAGDERRRSGRRSRCAPGVADRAGDARSRVARRGRRARRLRARRLLGQRQGARAASCSPATACATRPARRRRLRAPRRARKDRRRAPLRARGRAAFDDARARSARAAICARRPGSRASAARARCSSSTVAATRPRRDAAAADWRGAAPTRRRCREPRPEGLRRRRHPGAAGQARRARAGARDARARSSPSTADARGRADFHDRRRRSTSSARLPGAARAGAQRPGVVSSSARTTITSGCGDHHSLAPDSHAAAPRRRRQRLGHGGVLEVARQLWRRARRRCRATSCSSRSRARSRACSGRRTSRARRPPASPIADVRAMINLDMVGRLRDNRVDRPRRVVGRRSGRRCWPRRAPPRASTARPSTATASAPATRCRSTPRACRSCTSSPGSHADYHKPSDTRRQDQRRGRGADRGRRRRAGDAASAARAEPLDASAAARRRAPEGDVRCFNASLGTIPDYAGPPPGGARACCSRACAPGGAAEKAGLRRGDILVRLGPTPSAASRISCSRSTPASPARP